MHANRLLALCTARNYFSADGQANDAEMLPSREGRQRVPPPLAARASCCMSHQLIVRTITSYLMLPPCNCLSSFFFNLCIGCRFCRTSGEVSRCPHSSSSACRHRALIRQVLILFYYVVGSYGTHLGTV
mmetsp:Transcript_21605/g.49434  ORF Transcript_21605/g.49434 Transcript_21605/m.49434 type:complete len:129 (-) Transcript_21605:96-482(-)